MNTLCKDDSYMELHEATLMKTFSNKCACVLHKFWGTNKKLFLVQPYKINFDSIFTVMYMSITTTSYIASLPSFSVVLFITKFEFSSVIASFKSWRCNLDSSIVHKLIPSFFLKGSKHSLLALLITTDWLNCCLVKSWLSCETTQGQQGEKSDVFPSVYGHEKDSKVLLRSFVT